MEKKIEEYFEIRFGGSFSPISWVGSGFDAKRIQTPEEARRALEDWVDLDKHKGGEHYEYWKGLMDKATLHWVRVEEFEVKWVDVE